MVKKRKNFSQTLIIIIKKKRKIKKKEEKTQKCAVVMRVKLRGKENFDVQTPSCKLNILASRRLLDSLRYILYLLHLSNYLLLRSDLFQVNKN